MKYPWKIVVTTMCFLYIIYYLYKEVPRQDPYLVMCDVGQGDAFLLVDGYNTVVIDGGAPHSGVLQCLSSHTAMWDRTIELVVLTHPDLDHFGGLQQVVYTLQGTFIYGSKYCR